MKSIYSCELFPKESTLKLCTRTLLLVDVNAQSALTVVLKLLTTVTQILCRSLQGIEKALPRTPEQGTGLQVLAMCSTVVMCRTWVSRQMGFLLLARALIPKQPLQKPVNARLKTQLPNPLDGPQAVTPRFRQDPMVEAQLFSLLVISMLRTREVPIRKRAMNLTTVGKRTFMLMPLLPRLLLDGWKGPAPQLLKPLA